MKEQPRSSVLYMREPRDAKQQEFADAFERHSDELFRHCAMRIADRERALELTQEAFTRTWEYQCRGNEIHEYRPFLFRTLRHLIIDEYRKGKMQSLEALVEHVEGGEVEDLLPQD